MDNALASKKNMAYDLKWVGSRRGQKTPVVDNYAFRLKDNNANGKNYWSCSHTGLKCSVRLITVGSVLQSLNGSHEHSPYYAKPIRTKFLVKTKSAVKANPTMSGCQVLMDNTLASIKETFTSHAG